MNLNIRVRLSLPDQSQLVEGMLCVRENGFSAVPQLGWQTSACRGSMRERIKINCRQNLILPSNRLQLGKPGMRASKWSEEIHTSNCRVQEGTVPGMGKFQKLRAEENSKGLCVYSFLDSEIEGTALMVNGEKQSLLSLPKSDLEAMEDKQRGRR